MKGDDAAATTDPKRSLRRARQVLRTDLMLGVDFVPLPADMALTAERAIAAPAPNRVAPVPPPPERSNVSMAARGDTAAARPQGPAIAPRPAAARPAAPVAPPALVESKPRSAIVLDARQQESQRKLDELRARYEREAPHAKFVTDHHCIVFGDGDPCARLMIIGEAPGAEEDRVGLPFVGKAGQLLEKMLTAMGLPRSRVYITNVLKTRPPNNATPTSDEAAACAPYLFEQIRIVSPEAILALGLPATRVLLNTVESMSRLRGRWWTYSDPRTLGYEVPVMPTYHPAFLLRSYTRENREKVWSDLRMIMSRLDLRPNATADASPSQV